MIADVTPHKSSFLSAIWLPDEHKSWFDSLKNFIVYWDRGHIFLYGQEAGKRAQKEVLYAHLQKRPLKMKRYDPSCESFAIYPNGVLSIPPGRNAEKVLSRLYRRARIRGVFRPDELGHWADSACSLWKHRFKKYILRKP